MEIKGQTIRDMAWYKKLDEYAVKAFVELSQSPPEEVNKHVTIHMKKRRGEIIVVNVDGNIGECSYEEKLPQLD